VLQTYAKVSKYPPEPESDFNLGACGVLKVEYGAAEMTWLEGNQNNLPCVFTEEKATQNFRYLEQLLGKEFLRGNERQRAKNALLKAWYTTGVDAYSRAETAAFHAPLRVSVFSSILIWNDRFHRNY
jgi:hypothetical protein